jgi:transcription termination factor NusB
MPKTLINGALIAAKRYFGSDSNKMINGLKNLWPKGEAEEVDNLIQIMFP